MTAITSPSRSLEQVTEMLESLRRLRDTLMIEGVHYGPPHPGADKPVLLKPGAEVLCAYFGFRSRVEIIHAERALQGPEPFVFYEIKCQLVATAADGTEIIAGEGLGSATSLEAKHRYRTAERSCPECGATAIIRGKPEFGGGWVCWRNAGGCGAKFAADDPRITDQPSGKVVNAHVYDTFNAVLKVAKKRAFIDAVLSATSASFLFTQDEDALDPPPARRNGQASANVSTTERPAQSRPAPATAPTAATAPATAPTAAAVPPPDETDQDEPLPPAPRAEKAPAAPAPSPRSSTERDPDEPWQQIIAEWDESNWKFYWRTMREKGLSPAEVRAALGVSRVEDFRGTRGEHNRLISRAIDAKRAQSSSTQEITLARVDILPGFELDEHDLYFYAWDANGREVLLARQTLADTEVLEWFPGADLATDRRVTVYEDSQDFDQLVIAHFRPASNGRAEYVERIEYRQRPRWTGGQKE